MRVYRRDGSLVQPVEAEEASQIPVVTVWYLLNTTTGAYVPITVEGVGDARQMVLGTEVANPAANFFNVLYLKNTTTGKFVTVTAEGPAGMVQLVLGAEIP